MGRTEIPLQILDPVTGTAIVGAQSRIVKRADGLDAIVYTGETGTQQATNPVASDQWGRVNGWLDTGRYSALISGGGLVPTTEHFDSVSTQDIGVVGGGPGPPRVTSLPGSPVDGQEVFYVANAVTGTLWNLRFNNAGGTYKWEFVGGPPLQAQVVALESTGSTLTYIDLTTPGPAIAVPLAGEYLIELSGKATISSSNNALMSFTVGATAPLDDDAVGVNAVAVNTGNNSSLSRRLSKTLAAPATLTAKYRNTSSAGGASWQYRVLSALPVRVG